MHFFHPVDRMALVEVIRGKQTSDEAVVNVVAHAKALGKKPIVAANNYTANHYPRGAATLNMIRHIVGDSGWWNSA